MKIIYTKHSNIRITQRKLSKEQIEMTINNPDKILPGFSKRTIARKYFGHDTLEVVYVKEQENVIVITVYWL